MPLYSIAANKLTHIEQSNFRLEKTLQGLIQHNLKTVFNCRLVASEFSTGAQHTGRIDMLALSEKNNPVIIEYKKVESSELINQSLYYLAWLRAATPPNNIWTNGWIMSAIWRLPFRSS